MVGLLEKQQEYFSESVRKQISRDTPFAWFQFDNAKRHGRFYFVDFVNQSNRLEAQLDALGILLSNGESVDALINLKDWGACFVLALLGVRHGCPELFDQALDHLDENEETHPRELVDACLWDQCSSETLNPWLLRLMRHSSPLAQQAAIAVTRALPITFKPDILQYLLDQKAAPVRIQLLNLLGEQRMSEQLPFIRQHYDHDNHDIAYAAARAGMLLGNAESSAALGALVLNSNPRMFDAVALQFIRSQNADQKSQWIDTIWRSDEISIRVKLYAIAIAGLPEHVDKLFQPMSEEETSRAAGEAFTLLTGADLDLEDLEAISSDCETCDDDIAEQPTLSQRRQQDPFISDWEDDLPDPCPDATHDWWERNRSRFINGVTYLAGLEASEENLKSVLRNGNQRQRHLAAQYLHIRYNQSWLDCGWPVWLQQT